MLNTGRTALVAIFALVPLVAWPAAAQGQETGRLLAGVGAGVGLPLNADYRYRAPAWDVSIRADLTTHLLAEIAFTQWRHDVSADRFDIRLQDPNGVIGHIERLTQETHESTWVAQVNVLRRFTSGRVELFAGGGGGLLTLDRRYRDTPYGCLSSIATACAVSENAYSSTSVSGQAVGGGDVRLTGRISSFGQIRFSMPVRDPGYSDIRAVAGIRVRLR